MVVTERLDLIVIGGGSGGLAHAQRAAEHGARAAVIESGALGGTCVNVGCVPKKVMWYAASHAHHANLASSFGFDVAVERHHWPLLKERRDAYVKRLNDIYEHNLDTRGIELVRGRARFLDRHTIAVGDDRYEAERVVIATGGRPIVPRIHGAELGITSDGFFELPERPQRVALVGSGYVAVELGGVFSALGSDTTLLVRKDGVLRSFDSMLREELHLAMRQEGITLETAVVPHALEKTADGLRLCAEDGREFGPFDCVVWAVGRAPNIDGLDTEAALIESDGYGFVPVDDYRSLDLHHIQDRL